MESIFHVWMWFFLVLEKILKSSKILRNHRPDWTTEKTMDQTTNHKTHGWTKTQGTRIKYQEGRFWLHSIQKKGKNGNKLKTSAISILIWWKILAKTHAWIDHRKYDGINTGYKIQNGKILIKMNEEKKNWNKFNFEKILKSWKSLRNHKP